jgi:hypothetical protein
MFVPKQQFILKLMHERDRFELLLNRVGYTRRMTLKGVAGKWSIKDMLALLWAHEQYLADRMNEINQHQRYSSCKTQTALDAFLDEFGYPDFGSPLLDDDSPDEWVIARFKNVSLEELVAQEIDAFSSILSALDEMSDATINRHHMYERVGNHTYERYRVHMREIKRWLKVNGIQIN